MDVKIEAGWKQVLSAEFSKPYFLQIVQFLKTEKEAGKVIFPPGSLLFNAFNTTPFEKVKVVLLGQDPYHGPGQAMGLSFSVADGVAQPPSLQNIFKELKTDIGIPAPRSGNLTHWAQQGVLLLNSSLTVRQSEANSHSRINWFEFTDMVIRKISEHKEHVVFLLWGRFAQDKEVLIDQTKHLVLKAAHPSPFSVEKGFYGSRPFSKTNEYLIRNGIEPIDWQIK